MFEEINKYKIEIIEKFDLKYLETMFALHETYEGTTIKQKLIANLGKQIFELRVAIDKVIDRDKNSVEYSTSLYVFNEKQLNNFIEKTLSDKLKIELDKRLLILKEKLEANNA